MQWRYIYSNSANDLSFYETKLRSSLQSQESIERKIGDSTNKNGRRMRGTSDGDSNRKSRPNVRNEPKSKERRKASHNDISKDLGTIGGILNASSKFNRKRTPKKKGNKRHTRHDNPASKQPLAANSVEQGLKKATRRVDLPPVSPLQKYHVFVSCLPGLEPFLCDELMSIGIQPLVHEKENISGKGGLDVKISSKKDMYKCHLYLGTASHVFLRATPTFRALGMEELCLKVSRLDFWRQYIPMEDNPPSLDIRVTSTKSRLFHTKGIGERVERGILNAIGFDGQSILDTKSVSSQIPTETEGGRGQDIIPIKIMVRIHRNEVDISVDTSKSPLHRRGYRGEGGKAPLREDLAFALLYSSGWRDNLLRGEQHGLMDPMCGSGTIVIEGAAMALGMPPGRLRAAPFERSRLSNEKLWDSLVSSALDNVSVNLEKFELIHGNSYRSKNMILGSDRDEGVIDVASSNAERAGVSDFTSLKHNAISSNSWFENPTLAPSSIMIATNPPYGRRISKSKGINPLLPLYQTLGQKTGRLPGNVDLTILAQDVSLARRTGIADLKLQFASKHGGLNVFALGSKNVFLHGS